MLPVGFSAYGIKQRVTNAKMQLHSCREWKVCKLGSLRHLPKEARTNASAVTPAPCTREASFALLPRVTPGLGTDTTGPFVYLLSLPPFQRNSAEEPSITSLHQTPARPGNHFPRLLVFNTQCIINQIPHPDREKIEQLIA